jgi:hypothetical protein
MGDDMDEGDELAQTYPSEDDDAREEQVDITELEVNVDENQDTGLPEVAPEYFTRRTTLLDSPFKWEITAKWTDSAPFASYNSPCARGRDPYKIVTY